MTAPLQIQDCWKIMLRGSEMLKLSRGKLRRRTILKKTFYLEHDLSAISYTPKKNSARLESSSIISVTFDECVEKSAQSYGGGFPKNCSMALKLKSGQKFIIVAPTPELAEVWRLGLKHLLDIGPRDPRNHEGREMWLRNEFSKLPSTLGRVPFKEINEFLSSLDIGLKPQPDFIKGMKEFGVNKATDTLNADEFIAFFNARCTKKYEVALLKGLSSNGIVLTPEDVEYFLRHVQKQPDVTYEACVKFIGLYEPSELGREKKELCLEGLTRYLLSEEGDVFNNEHDLVYHDMTQPLNHYFICSSHNTYLMGDQLSSMSSAQPYVDALKKGYKCVEIDCHDGKGGEPSVYHKHTLTTEVALTEVLTAIKENAFVTSPYPVIISVENHCSVETQKKMARYFEEIFGDLLQKEPLLDTQEVLPSPEALRNQILVRGKKQKPSSGDGKRSSTLVESDIEEVGISGPPEVEHEGKTYNLQPPSGPKHKVKITEEFSRLINVLENKKFVSFESSKASMKFYHSSSFSESQLADLSGANLVHFNKKQTSRIYPAGSRMGSGNYNPQTAWNSGCQIVALNQQTTGMATDLNLGRFRQNGRAGYNLKPRFLRDVEWAFDPSTNHETAGIQGKLLRIVVISASLLPPGDTHMGYRDIPDPYVMVDIHGINGDNSSDRTKTVWNNPFNPHWAESFEKKIHNPELAMVRFSVYDDDPGFDDFMGQFSLPLPSLQAGFRRVHLLDKEGRRLSGASLFVYTEFSDLTSHKESPKPSKCRVM